MLIAYLCFVVKAFVTLFFLLCLFSCKAQRLRPAREELIWAVFHPASALKVNRISKICDTISRSPAIKARLDNSYSGGSSDAFRHTFYMAAFSQKIPGKALRKLGKCHERKNYRDFLRSKFEDGERPDSIASVMDLHNNEVGIAEGQLHRDLSLVALSNHVLQMLPEGKCLVIVKDQYGRFKECSGKVIDLNQYKNKWYIPKCLVTSEYLYAD